jgi:hypothetical protein
MEMGELFQALAKAQKEFKPAVKDANNPFFKSKYANLEGVVDAVREALAKHDLCFIQKTKLAEGSLVLETIVGHKSGSFISGEYPIKPVKEDPQAIGSAITYAKRYALAAMLGVVTSDEDDDGESAMGRGGESQQHQSQPPQVKSFQASVKSVAPLCCGKSMMKSKFHESMFYCTQCKATAPMAKSSGGEPPLGSGGV